MTSAAKVNSTAAAATVVATFGRSLLLIGDDGKVVEAVRRGRRGDAVVGDRVRATFDDDALAVVESIEPRVSLLYRADANRTKELAANIDQVMVVFASRPSFDREFIWKALVAAHAADIEATVIRNKVDVADGAEHAAAMLRQLHALGSKTLEVSAHDDAAARAALAPHVAGRRTLLIGQSGMGKSTLLNLLVPEAQVRTQEYSRHLNVGKQTTTASRWFPMADGGALVDTPGFREFGLSHLNNAQIAAGFPEFERAFEANSCRFLDCAHLDEPDCAIRAALDRGDVAPERYAFYRSLIDRRRT
ncbi:MAG: ribosome small subunit-dependent GTPase A [Burkholderiaceae bacterium]